MMMSRASRRIGLVGGVVLAAILPAYGSGDNGFETLYSFRGGGNGAEPLSPLISDSKGNLYGTTSAAGSTECGTDYCGTVFRLTRAGNKTILHDFTGGTDGMTPRAGLLMDKTGTLYGTTQLGGGAGGCNDGKTSGCGTVFELAPDGTETVLYHFTGGSDGGQPESALVVGSRGTLYGTTPLGGAEGDGTVYEVAPNGTETVLHSFTGGSDDGQPSGGLVIDRKGNLYGTTLIGGKEKNGVVYRVASDGTETVLYNFCSLSVCADGGQPAGTLLLDKHGNLFGTAGAGGAAGQGAVFEASPTGTETAIYSFQGSGDGIQPAGGVITDGRGNLYGTTYLGGTNEDGIIFAISPTGSERVLYDFAGKSDGENPSTALLLFKNELYGTTDLGGVDSEGNVFRIGK